MNERGGEVGSKWAARQTAMIQAVQMEFKRQLQRVSWEIKPQKCCSASENERVNLKTESKGLRNKTATESAVVLLLNREADRGASLGFQDWDIDPKLLWCLQPFSSSGVILRLFSSLNPEERWALWTLASWQNIHIHGHLPPLFLEIKKLPSPWTSLVSSPALLSPLFSFLQTGTEEYICVAQGLLTYCRAYYEICCVLLCFDVKPHLMSAWDSHSILHCMYMAWLNLPKVETLNDFKSTAKCIHRHSSS